MGDATSGPVRPLLFPKLRVEFWGTTVPSDAGLLLPRELDALAGERNYQGLTCLNSDLVPHETIRSVSRDSDSSERPVHGAQESSRRPPGCWHRML